MDIWASEVYSYYRPSKCELRVYLRQRGLPEAPAGPYDELMRSLGKEHETGHLESLDPVLDIGTVPVDQRVSATIDAIGKNAPVIYHGRLEKHLDLDSLHWTVIGEPDFMIKSSDGYIIRDSKISRRITPKDHPEVIDQMLIYGWLFEVCTGNAPQALEVHAGTGEIVDIPYEGETEALAALRRLVELKTATEQPLTPVGWSKCSGCGFFDHCWPKAVEDQDVATVEGVDQGLAVALKVNGIHTAEELLDSFTEVSLAEFKRPWGKREQKVGKKAGSILLSAKSIVTGQEILVQTPNLPAGDNFVAFDLEGLPPQLDQEDTIFLWGLQVFGARPTEFLAALAPAGSAGDQQAWNDFLDIADGIFRDYGDIPFLHWHHYEKTHIRDYIERYSDRDGLATRVLENLVDLLPITRGAIVLPIPSYSLKVIEKYIGYERTMEEYGGDWAMAKYIEACRSGDEEERQAILENILLYNREDLEATQAVFEWLRGK